MDFSKRVASGKLTRLQWEIIHSRIFGQHKLVLIGFYFLEKGREAGWVRNGRGIGLGRAGEGVNMIKMHIMKLSKQSKPQEHLGGDE